MVVKFSNVILPTKFLFITVCLSEVMTPSANIFRGLEIAQFRHYEFYFLSEVFITISSFSSQVIKESSCQHFFNTTHDIINYDVIENNDFLKLEYLENETEKSKISKGLNKQLFMLYNI